MTEHRLPPIHPGEILLEEFLKPMTLVNTAWPRIGAFQHDVSMRLSKGSAPLVRTALRLSRYFGLSERFWMNLRPA
jgi:addiction module HigA family antidote